MIRGMSTETGTRKLFTIDEFIQIEDAGVFPPDSRFELIYGEILEMPEPTGRHIGRVNKLTRLFTSTLGESVIVSVQNAVHMQPRSRPRPDIVLCKPLPELFGPYAPKPDDVLLLVEISDMTVRYDRKTKAKLYAEVGIPEYWILNIPAGSLEVWTDPAEGQYRRAEILKSGQSISPRKLPGVTFAVKDILE
jgi:Uma2 family endonuclease